MSTPHVQVKTISQAGKQGQVIAGNKGIIYGDVDIQSLIMSRKISPQKSLDIAPYVQSINIYEGIMSPVIIAELAIIDAVDFLQTFPVLGEEEVELVFNTPGQEDQVTYNFIVDKVVGITIDNTAKHRKYTMYLVSEHQLTNCTKGINRRLRSASGSIGSTISEAVESILKKDIKTTKKLVIEPTSNIVDKTLTNISPYQAIDYLRQLAISEKYKSNAFVFYETCDSFVFASIEYLFDINRQQEIKKFFMSGDSLVNTLDSNYRSIISYMQMNYIDTTSAIASGAYGNKTNIFDIITGDNTLISYSKAKDKANYQYADVDPSKRNTAEFIEKHSSAIAATKIVAVSSDEPKTDIGMKFASQQSYVADLTQHISHMKIYGDSSLRPGTIIECNFNRPIGYQTDEPDSDSPQTLFDSGNYMISKIRHIIGMGSRPTHYCSLEIIKGNFLEKA